MLKIRQRYTGSWLDPDAQGKLSFDLTNRLLERCTDENGRAVKGVFITLTYRPREYRNPLDLYKTHGERQDVPMFFRRLSKFLGQKLTGRWLCKQEFQQNGAVHWHIVLLGVDFIPHANLADLWGHGFAFIQTLNKEKLRYACKYVSKGGGLPPFLLGEAPRSVKIIRVSPGFWDKNAAPIVRTRQPEPPPLPEGQAYIEDYGMTPQDVDGPFFLEDVPKNTFCHETMEKRLGIAKRKAVVVDMAEGKFIQLNNINFNCLMVAAVQKGGKFLGREKGWMMIDGLHAEDLEMVGHCARRLERGHLKEQEADYDRTWGLALEEGAETEEPREPAVSVPPADWEQLPLFPDESHRDGTEPPPHDTDARTGGPAAPSGGVRADGRDGGRGLHLIDTRNPDWKKEAEARIPLHLRRGYPKWAADHWLWDALNSSVWNVSQILQDVHEHPEGENWEMAA